MPESLLRALDLTIAQRVEGLLPGEHRSSLLGMGTELAQIREYQPGVDDVRHIDWSVTARTTVPHVRVHLAERSLVTWLVVDISASMEFGTAERRKADVAEGAALALGYIAARRANRLGVMTFGGPGARVEPPRMGRAGLLNMLLALRESDGDDEPGARGVTSTGAALAELAAVARQPAVVALISDFRGPRDWRQPLLTLAGRHRVLAVEVRDPREQELPRFGELRLVDPETGRHLRVDTSNERLRTDFARAAAAERHDVAAELARAGVRHVVVSTEGDWLRELVGFLRHAGAR